MQWCYINMFQAWWKNSGFYGIVNISQMKFEIYEFFLIILVGISEYWDVLFNFNSLISVSISLKLISLKLKAPLLLYLVLIAIMVACFSYLRIPFKLGSSTFSIIGSKSEYWKMLRFFTILPKKIVKTSGASFTVFTISPFSLKLILSLAMNFSDSEGFAVSQKSLLSNTFLSSKLSH